MCPSLHLSVCLSRMMLQLQLCKGFQPSTWNLVGWCTEPWSRLLINSWAPGRFQFYFRNVIFKLTLVNGGWGISYEIALRWMALDLTDDQSTLVQVMAWCRQATSHYLSQCWPRSMSPNGVTRPQWVKMTMLGQFCVFHGTLNFPCLAWTRAEGRRYRSNSLRISGISLKFDRAVHSTTKQIAI